MDTHVVRWKSRFLHSCQHIMVAVKWLRKPRGIMKILELYVEVSIMVLMIYFKIQSYNIHATYLSIIVDGGFLMITIFFILLYTCDKVYEGHTAVAEVIAHMVGGILLIAVAGCAIHYCVDLGHDCIEGAYYCYAALNILLALIFMIDACFACFTRVEPKPQYVCPETQFYAYPKDKLYVLPPSYTRSAKTQTQSYLDKSHPQFSLYSVTMNGKMEENFTKSTVKIKQEGKSMRKKQTEKDEENDEEDEEASKDECEEDKKKLEEDKRAKRKRKASSKSKECEEKGVSTEATIKADKCIATDHGGHSTCNHDRIRYIIRQCTEE